ncbi:MAG: hypothetical protein JSS59_06585 [Proteobacteria bacterium]|uniref:hypothetical protein n=1 Tax=Rudaea sp. TaxID=2136325 RepID=UPI0037839745|nr:hypothetical protein [Pseudomonadota bacterium]
MTLAKTLLALAVVLMPIEPTFAAQNDSRMIEIYHIAPGKHVEFLKLIAQYDEANRQAGLPPRELYVHSDGGSWDFLLIQNENADPAKQALVDAALKKLGAPTGAKFWVAIRQAISEHSDTVATGPTTAGDWLKKLEN